MSAPADILRLGNAFCPAQALLTAAELDLFTFLDDRPRPAAEVRDALGLHGRGLAHFLDLLVELGLLARSGDRYANAPGAARHLVSGRPGAVTGALVGTRANLYPLWGDLAETLRTGRPRSDSAAFAAMLEDPEALRRYARMMDGGLRPVLAALLDAVDWSSYRSVLDVGGCRGDLVAALLERQPHLTGHVFDLPALEPLFDEHLAGLGVTAARFHAGDFFRDPLPRADVLVFGHVLHNWPPERRELLLHRAFEAITPGGLLLVHDRMLDDARTHVENLVVSLTMALVTEGGSEYTVGELAALARSAGFEPPARRSLDADETLAVFRKPAVRPIG